MLNKFFTAVTILTLFVAVSSFAQITYQGPATGNVASGVQVSTNSFPESPINFDPKPIVVRNNELPESGPIIFEDDGAILFQPTYVNDPNVVGGINAIGENTLLLNKFPGIPETNSIPPDPHVAVGPNHVIATVNSRFSIWDKEGNLLKSIDADQWCLPLLSNPGAFDPQVIYDHYEGRWFMLWDNQNDATQTAYFFIFYSDDSDPLGTWYGYKLDARTNGNTVTNTWGDYPQIGFDDKAIYINSRQFYFTGGKLYDKIRILNKTELYASNGGPLTWKDLWGITIPGTSQFADIVHPSYHYSNAADHYFVYAPRSGGNFYALYKLSNPLTTPTLTGVRITVPFFGQAPDANQLGGGALPISVNGSHVKNAPIFRNGFLYLSHSIRNSVYPFYGSLQYAKIDVATNSVVESAELGAEGYFYMYPTIAVDADGNIAITCSRSADTEYCGSYYVTRRATDPPGLSGAFELSPGLGNYVKDFGSGRNRWGDYLGIFLDPTDQYSFWLFPEHAAATNTWGTTVGHIRIKPFPGIYVYSESFDLDFGDIEVGFESNIFDVVIANYGEDNLVINDIPAAVGDFQRTSTHSFPITLSTYDSLTISFKFSPTSQGPVNVAYNISNNSSSFTGFNMSGNGFVINAANPTTLFAISGTTNNGNFLSLNTSTGEGTNIGESNFTELIDIAIHPTLNLVYGLRATPLQSDLVRINGQDGDGYPFITLPVPDLYSIAFDNNGDLFGIQRTGNIYKFALPSGDSTYFSKAQANLITIAFEPGTNQLWGTVRNIVGNPKDQVIKINLQTGDTTRVGVTGFGANTVGIEFDENGTLYGFKGTGANVADLFTIDKITGQGTLIGSVGLQGVNGLGYTLNPTLSVGDDGGVVPNEYVLEQNYPNPFNPSTVIRFSLPVNSNVKLVIFNLLGQVVNELVNGEFASGNYNFTWNGNDSYGNKVSSGIYFYELKANGTDGKDFTQVKKMMLLK